MTERFEMAYLLMTTVPTLLREKSALSWSFFESVAISTFPGMQGWWSGRRDVGEFCVFHFQSPAIRGVISRCVEECTGVLLPYRISAKTIRRCLILCLATQKENGRKTSEGHGTSEELQEDSSHTYKFEGMGVVSYVYMNSKQNKW